MKKNILVVLAFVLGGFFGYLSIQADFEMMRELREELRTEVTYAIDQEIALLDQLIQHAEVLESPSFSGNVLNADKKRSTRKDRASRRELLEQRKRLKERREKMKNERKVLDEERSVLDQPSKVERVLKSWEEKNQNAENTEQLWSDKSTILPSAIHISVLDRSGNQQLDLREVHKAQIAAALQLMPAGFEDRLKKLYLVKNDAKMSRRGMSGPGVVFIKEENDDIFSVLLHEFGHIWDFHAEVFDGELSDYSLGQYRFYLEDPSIDFYQLSWSDAITAETDKRAYASGYAMSKYYEDFAEAFTLYILQNKTFSQWALENPQMAKKYEYMRSVFDNSRNDSRYLYIERPFDVTKMPFELEDVL